MWVNKMKKKWIVLGLCILLGGCTETVVDTPDTTPQANTLEASPTPEATTAPTVENTTYSEYQTLYSKQTQVTSYTTAVQCNYVMHFDNESTEEYQLDGVLKAQDVSGRPVAHITQYFNANGLQSVIEGNYYDGRLYNNYNRITYYEDLSYEALKEVMLVPLDSIRYKEAEIEEITKEENAEGTTFLITLKDEAAESYFLDHFDFYGLAQYEVSDITVREIKQHFDPNGYLSEESFRVSCNVKVEDSNIQIDYDSTVSNRNMNATVVEISEETKTAEAKYVHFNDIDTNAISNASVTSDQEEETATATFKKRLVSRLQYKQQADGTYRSDFNDSETYVVDFDNRQFSYTNYGVLYVYNWAGDTGGFGTSCNVDFKTRNHSSDCQESALEMIQNVKLYFEMELYYCGLSLEDLQKEAE